MFALEYGVVKGLEVLKVHHLLSVMGGLKGTLVGWRIW